MVPPTEIHAPETRQKHHLVTATGWQKKCRNENGDCMVQCSITFEVIEHHLAYRPCHQNHSKPTFVKIAKSERDRIIQFKAGAYFSVTKLI